MREHEIIGKLREAFGSGFIGDDAAVIEPPAGELLLATDAMVEGVHFDLRWSTIGQAAQKLVTSNVSDIYAMGSAVPRSVLVTAGLPEGFDGESLESLIEGLRIACGAYGVDLVGGDTVRSPGGFFLNAAVAGTVEPGRAVRRSGAREGDQLVLFGTVGGSLAGHRLLSSLVSGGAGNGETIPPPDGWRSSAVKEAVRSITMTMGEKDLRALCEKHRLSASLVPALAAAACHLVPRARGLPGGVLSGSAGDLAALIDISDGLAADLHKMCTESGVGAVIEARRLPTPRWLDALIPTAEDEARLELALSSGEEYALLAAVRGPLRGRAASSSTVIGSIAPSGEGIVLVGPDGERRPLPPAGYEHDF